MPLVVEKDIETYLKMKVKDYGGWCIKFSSAFETGIPDRIVILSHGVVAFVEVKRPKGGELSEMQKYQIGKLKGYGVDAYVVWNYRDIDIMMEELKAKGKENDKRLRR